jgi:hypothetical protein
MAVLVADSMSLIFFRDRPQMRVCIESSSFIASTVRFNYDHKSVMMSHG